MERIEVQIDVKEKMDAIIDEVEKKYEELCPYAMNLISKEWLREHCYCLSEKIQGLNEKRAREEIDFRYNSNLLFVLFGGGDKKEFEKSYRKSLDSLMWYLQDPVSYDYLMKNMPEFCEFEKRIGEETRKKCKKRRRVEGGFNVLHKVRSLGVSALIDAAFNGAQRKRLKKLVGSVAVKEVVKLITYSETIMSEYFS